MLEVETRAQGMLSMCSPTELCATEPSHERFVDCFLFCFVLCVCVYVCVLPSDMPSRIFFATLGGREHLVTLKDLESTRTQIKYAIKVQQPHEETKALQLFFRHSWIY